MRSRRTGLGAERKLVYADSSALVKLVVDEPESPALERHLTGGSAPISSRIARVEVLRACRMVNPAPEVEREARRLLAAIMLLDLTHAVLDHASQLASKPLRTLDSLHLASALHVGADELVAYDRRLLAAAHANGISTASPGP